MNQVNNVLFVIEDIIKFGTLLIVSITFVTNIQSANALMNSTYCQILTSRSVKIQFSMLMGKVKDYVGIAITDQMV